MRERPHARRHEIRGVHFSERRRGAHPHVLPTATEKEPFKLVEQAYASRPSTGAEERVAPGGLSEDTRVRKQPRHARLAACRVEAVDTVCEQIQSDVLCECHSHRESARVKRHTCCLTS
jgi:hypothetical protein